MTQTMSASADPLAILHEQLQLVRSPDTPASMLEELARHAGGGIRIVLAGRHDALPDTVVQILTQDPDRSVRELAAGRIDLPPYLTEGLSNSAYDDVRASIARSDPDLTEECLRLLASSNPVVRVATAGRRVLPYDIVEILSVDDDDEVRVEIALRADLSEAVCNRLAEDPCPEVRLAILALRPSSQAVADTLSLFEDVAIVDIDHRILERIAKNHVQHEAILPRYVHAGTSVVRTLLADWPTFKPAPLVLCQHHDPTVSRTFMVTERFAKNPATQATIARVWADRVHTWNSQQVEELYEMLLGQIGSRPDVVDLVPACYVLRYARQQLTLPSAEATATLVALASDNLTPLGELRQIAGLLVATENA